jgi:hypothetical protein
MAQHIDHVGQAQSGKGRAEQLRDASTRTFRSRLLFEFPSERFVGQQLQIDAIASDHTLRYQVGPEGGRQTHHGHPRQKASAKSRFELAGSLAQRRSLDIELRSRFRKASQPLSQSSAPALAWGAQVIEGSAPHVWAQLTDACELSRLVATRQPNSLRFRRPRDYSMLRGTHALR